MTKKEDEAQAAKSELVAEAIRLGVPSYEAWLMSDEQLAALIPTDDEE
jgi:hypothetical protein